MARRLRLERISKSPAVFDEKKLRHFNGRYLRELSVDELTARIEAFTGRTGLRDGVEISREKIQTLADFWPLAGFLYDGPVEDEAAWSKTIGAEGGAEALAAAREVLDTLDPFTQDAIDVALRALVEQRGWKPKQVFQPVRVAIAGTTISPGIFESVALLGREETLRRIDAALARSAGAAA